MPKKRYAVVRLWGSNDADERQQAKTTAEMRRQEQAKEVQAYEERGAQRALSDDVSGIPGHCDRQRASGDAGHQPQAGLQADRLWVHPRREDRYDAENPENQRHQLCDGEGGEESWMRSSA